MVERITPMSANGLDLLRVTVDLLRVHFTDEAIISALGQIMAEVAMKNPEAYVQALTGEPP